MKTTLLKVLALVLLAILAHYTTVAAQPAHDRPARREVRAYYQANVLPAVRQQRQKLEAQLSGEDKSLLATYRTRLRDVRQRGQTLRRSLRPASPAPDGTRPALTDAQRQQVQQLRAEARGIMLSVAQLAQKYDARITELTQELQPQREKWAADIKAIVAKNTTPEQQSALGRFGRLRHHGGLGAFSRPARFLLLDPNAAPATREPATPGSTAFPNPAATALQLEYAVKKAGPVTVEVLDARGTVLQTLVQQEQQDKGLHKVSTNVSELPAGAYFYKITTRSGSETKRFVKQ